jgi:quercetin dioxygenase-like cupin family protein
MKIGAFVVAGAVLAAGSAALCLMGGSAAVAQSGGVMAVQQGPNTKTYDIPPAAKPQTVIITTRDFVAGETVGAHIHHGVEMTQVVKGSFEIFIKGQPPKVIKAGESFLVPRGLVHDGRPAAGSGPVHVAVTLVLDKGSVPRTPVSDVLIPK